MHISSKIPTIILIGSINKLGPCYQDMVKQAGVKCDYITRNRLWAWPENIYPLLRTSRKNINPQQIMECGFSVPKLPKNITEQTTSAHKITQSRKKGSILTLFIQVRNLSRENYFTLSHLYDSPVAMWPQIPKPKPAVPRTQPSHKNLLLPLFLRVQHVHITRLDSEISTFLLMRNKNPKLLP